MREERTKEESYTLKDLIYNKTYGPIYNSIYNKRKDISSDIYILYISSYISQRKIHIKNFGMFVYFSSLNEKSVLSAQKKWQNIWFFEKKYISLH